MDGCLAGMHFRHCRLSSLWPMLAGSVPGSFAGLYILQICSGAVLQGPWACCCSTMCTGR